MSNPLLIDPRNLPAEGRRLAGQLPPSFFELAAEDPVKAVGPLDFELQAVRDGKDVVVTGRLQAAFSLQCGRCTERFDHAVDLPDYELEVEIEKDRMIDLTEPLREDILLALPSYPRCEDGNISPRPCPAEGRFEASSGVFADEAEQPAATESAVWNVLDQLKQQ